MTFLRYVLVIVVGYLLGSLSFSIILSRILGRDIRKQGSGNAQVAALRTSAYSTYSFQDLQTHEKKLKTGKNSQNF